MCASTCDKVLMGSKGVRVGIRNRRRRTSARRPQQRIASRHRHQSRSPPVPLLPLLRRFEFLRSFSEIKSNHTWLPLAPRFNTTYRFKVHFGETNNNPLPIGHNLQSFVKFHCNFCNPWKESIIPQPKCNISVFMRK